MPFNTTFFFTNFYETRVIYERDTLMFNFIEILNRLSTYYYYFRVNRDVLLAEKKKELQERFEKKVFGAKSGREFSEYYNFFSKEVFDNYLPIVDMYDGYF